MVEEGSIPEGLVSIRPHDSGEHVDSFEGMSVVDAHAFVEREEGDLADVAVEGLRGFVLDLGCGREIEEVLQGFEELSVYLWGDFVVNCYETTVLFEGFHYFLACFVP